jgi:hypothetical protein
MWVFLFLLLLLRRAGARWLLIGTRNHLYAAAENCYDASCSDRIYHEVVTYTHVLT